MEHTKRQGLEEPTGSRRILHPEWDEGPQNQENTKLLLWHLATSEGTMFKETLWKQKPETKYILILKCTAS